MVTYDGHYYYQVINTQPLGDLRNDSGGEGATTTVLRPLTHDGVGYCYCVDDYVKCGICQRGKK